MSARESVVEVSWVKGHATRFDVERGRTSEEDKKGNDGADALAVAGARMHQVPPEVLKAACERKRCAVNVQQMMLAVLNARLVAESNISSGHDADRGSDVDVHDCTQMNYFARMPMTMI